VGRKLAQSPANTRQVPVAQYSNVILSRHTSRQLLIANATRKKMTSQRLTDCLTSSLLAPRVTISRRKRTRQQLASERRSSCRLCLFTVNIHCRRSSAGTVHHLASVPVDLRRVVLSLQDVSNGNDVIGVGVDDNGVHRGALRGDLSSAASSDYVDTAQSTEGSYHRHPSSCVVPPRRRPAIQFDRVPMQRFLSLCGRDPGCYLPMTVCRILL